MMCLRHFLIFTLLIPMPSASPFFLAVFALGAFWVIRPCGYCIGFLAILFLSTSPSSPFLIAFEPSRPTTVSEPQPVATDSLLYSQPIPDRGPFYLNNWRLFDPTLVGYREMRRIWPKETDVQAKNGANITMNEDTNKRQLQMEASSPTFSEKNDTEEQQLHGEKREAEHEDLGWWPGKWKFGLSSHPSPQDDSLIKQGGPPDSVDEVSSRTSSLSGIPSSADHSTSLPAGYLDLRVKGVGLVLDLGWRRREDALKWEVEDWRAAAEAERRDIDARAIPVVENPSISSSRSWWKFRSGRRTAGEKPEEATEREASAADEQGRDAWSQVSFLDRW